MKDHCPAFLRLLIFLGLSLPSWLSAQNAIFLHDFFFDLGKSEVSAADARMIDSLAHARTDWNAAGYRFKLQGFADSTGNVDANLALSQRRVEAVAELLRRKFPAAKYSFEPLGEETASAKGLAHNRRLSLKLMDKPAPLEPRLPEVFCFIPSRDTTFMTARGTAILLKGNAFALPEAPTSKCITLSIHEAYSRADIILNRLQTESEGIPLISEGMVRLEARMGDQVLALAGGESVTYLVPTQKADPNMDAWSGRPLPDGRMNWTGEGVDMMGTIRGLTAECRDDYARFLALANLSFCAFQNRNFYASQSDSLRQVLAINCASCRFWCRLRILIKSIFSKAQRKANGTAREIRAQKREDEELPLRPDQRYLPELTSLLEANKKERAFRDTIARLERLMAEIDDSPCIRQRRTLDSLLSGMGFADQGAYLDSLWIGRERRGLETMKFGEKVPKERVDYYIIRSSTLDWVNVDALMKYPPEQRKTITVAQKPADETLVYLSFKNMNTVLAGRRDRSGYVFGYVPIDEPFKLSVLEMNEEGYRYGERMVSNVRSIDLIPAIPTQAISAKDLLVRLRKLDQPNP